MGYFTPYASAAFEVKSMPGLFREVDGQIDRNFRAGTDPVGMGVTTRVKSAADVIDEARPILQRISESLDRKVGANCSRNGFLIVHPFDHLVAENASIIMASRLPPLGENADLDTLWILWFPDHLTMWSRAQAKWIELIFSAHRPNDPVDDEEHDPSVLQRAGARLTEEIGYHGGDPYFFTFSVSSDESEG